MPMPSLMPALWVPMPVLLAEHGIVIDKVSIPPFATGGARVRGIESFVVCVQ